MSVKKFLKECYMRFFTDDIPLLERDISNDETYLESLCHDNAEVLDEQHSDMKRSFLQYKCQMYKLRPSKRIILNLFSPIASIVFVTYALVSACFIDATDDGVGLALVNGNIDGDLIPESLSRKYIISKCHDNAGFVLGYQEVKWVARNCGPYLLHPYFVLKVAVKVARYSFFIRAYSPEAIITSSEYSFCSSALTAFCEQSGISHINIMHGEKCFNIRDTFFRFTSCYVWNEWYTSLFVTLKADVDQFIVEPPPKHLAIIKLGNSTRPVEQTITFYWASEYDREELKFISEHLKKLAELGFTIIVRYHPLHKNAFLNGPYFFLKEFSIQDPMSVSLYDSLASTEYVFGTYTTVLYEGYLMNRKIIVNDFRYLSLLQLQTIATRLPHFRLSEFEDSISC